MNLRLNQYFREEQIFVGLPPGNSFKNLRFVFNYEIIKPQITRNNLLPWKSNQGEKLLVISDRTGKEQFFVFLSRNYDYYSREEKTFPIDI